MKDTCHLYSDLAWLWPMWGDAMDEYAHYCRYVALLIRQEACRSVSTLLDLGCGGGKNVLHLKSEFEVTGLDLSPNMLAQAKALNPECEFIEGDMRHCRINRTFDAVLMDDAVSHMNCMGDFSAAFQTAFFHLKPGGVLVTTPDVTTETFRQNQTVVSHAAARTKPDGFDAVFIENSYDPNPSDEQYDATIIYLIRERGILRVETDHWTLGLFPLNRWRSVLRETGFVTHEEKYSDGMNEFIVFVCTKPN